MLFVTNYIILGFFSPWLIWFSFLFYYTLIFDNTFNYYISLKIQLLKYWGVIGILALISFFIFFIRLYRKGIVIDIYTILYNVNITIKSLSWIDLLVLGMFFLLLIIFWILLLQCIYQHFRRCYLALYLYYFQFDFYRTYMCYPLRALYGNYRRYMTRRIRIFTKNHTVTIITAAIWPEFTDILENTIYKVIIPYLWIFDFIVHDGQISKVFMVLPWYYIYSLIRGYLILSLKLFTEENQDMSEIMYGLR